MNLSERNYQLDLIKVISALAVVGLHSFCKAVSPVNDVLYYLCGFSLPMFFMVSGSLLLNKKENTFKYCGLKIVKILRVLVIWNIIGCILFLPFYVYGVDYTLKDVPRLIVEQFIGCFFQQGNMWHLWYLGTMIFLYLFFGLLNLIDSNKTKKLIVIWSVFAFISFALQLYSYVTGYYLQGNVVQLFRVWTWFQFFLLGSIIYKKQQYIEKKLSKGFHLILLLSFTLLNVIFHYFHSFWGADHYYDDPLLWIWCALIFSYCLRLNLSEKKALRCTKLGSMSLGIYIIHPVLLRMMDVIIGEMSVIVSLVVYLMLVIYSVVIIFLLQKTPMQKMLFKL